MTKIRLLYLTLFVALFALAACSSDDGFTVRELEQTRIAAATEAVQEQENAESERIQTLERVAPDGTEIANPAPSRAHDSNLVIDPGDMPPLGGTHNPVWQNCSIYDSPIRPEHAVHSMEHGAVWIAYQPDLSSSDVSTLTRLADRPFMLLAPYPGLRSAVVASAWGVQLELDSVDDSRLEEFVTAFRLGPQTPEPGAVCTGGTADTVQ